MPAALLVKRFCLWCQEDGDLYFKFAAFAQGRSLYLGAALSGGGALSFGGGVPGRVHQVEMMALLRKDLAYDGSRRTG